MLLKQKTGDEQIAGSYEQREFCWRAIILDLFYSGGKNKIIKKGYLAALKDFCPYPKPNSELL